MVHFKAWGFKNTLGELCLKIARTVLIFRDKVVSIISFSVLKCFCQILKNFVLLI